jgi:flagella basal body P-ring formation protein FlgA
MNRFTIMRALSLLMLVQLQAAPAHAAAGSNYASTRSATQELSGARIEAIARDALAAQFPQYRDRWTLTVVNQPNGFTDGKIARHAEQRLISWTIKPLPKQALRRRMSAQVDIFLDNHPARSVRVAFDVSVPYFAATYAADYSAKTNVDQIQLKQASINLADVPGGIEALATQPASANRLRRNVRAGQAAQVRDFSQTPDVKKNEEVNMIVESNGIRIRARGRALSDGFIGQTIKIRIASGSFQGTVSGPNEVSSHAR